MRGKFIKFILSGAAIADSVNSIDINWISGSVDVLTHSDNTVTFSETSDKELDENNTLYYYLEADMVSGNIELVIPESSGFTVSFDSVSGKLNSDFEVTKEDDEYIFGDGNADYSVDTVSGSMRIEKLDTNIIL